MTRGKLWTGFLGLGLAGVAATANPRCKPAELGDVPPPTSPAAPAPKPVAPAPKPADPRAIINLDIVDINSLPPVSHAPQSEAKAPRLPAPAAATPPPVVSGPSSPPKLDLPQPAVPPPAIVSVPGANVPLGDIPSLPPAVVVAPQPSKVAQTVPGLPPDVPQPSLPTIPAAEPPLALPRQSSVPAGKADGSVKVVLKLGDGRPRLDVLSGEDTILKVCADKMDVRSPSDRGEPMSALKAGGKVSFTTPGCSGTCDDLTVFPRTGEVILAGNVSVTCREGKGETTLTADVLKFKVPAAPAYGLPEPSGVTPVSLKR